MSRFRRLVVLAFVATLIAAGCPAASLDDLPATAVCGQCGQTTVATMRERAASDAVSEWVGVVVAADGVVVPLCGDDCAVRYAHARTYRAFAGGSIPLAAAIRASRASLATAWTAVRLVDAMAEVARAAGVAIRFTAAPCEDAAQAAARVAALAAGDGASALTAEVRICPPITWECRASALDAVDELCQLGGCSWRWTAAGTIAIDPAPIAVKGSPADAR